LVTGSRPTLADGRLDVLVLDWPGDYGSFEPEPFTSGSMAQVHRATLPDRTPVAVNVLHEGADLRVRDDQALMQAVAAWLEEQHPECSRPIWRY
jgi:predicted unusual protein kinase regulating ubiquinone biosynthesis (AarF/ABC1/UbiB family)